jgi:hypothetical protein
VSIGTTFSKQKLNNIVISASSAVAKLFRFSGFQREATKPVRSFKQNKGLKSSDAQSNVLR